MGISILEMVLRLLREAKFTADIAYPGQKYPTLTKPVAAVHLEKVDSADLTVTVEVSIISPGSLGGGQCERVALQATEVLRLAGAACVQNGCSYDGIAQVYVVTVLATFTAVTESSEGDITPSFTVYVNDVYQSHGIGFAATRNGDHEVLYEIGEAQPVGIAAGNISWKLELEELFPPGEPEETQEAEPFTLTVIRDQVAERYLQCVWISEKREFGKQGLRRTRVGMAVAREVI